MNPKTQWVKLLVSEVVIFFCRHECAKEKVSPTVFDKALKDLSLLNVVCGTVKVCIKHSACQRASGCLEEKSVCD